MKIPGIGVALLVLAAAHTSGQVANSPSQTENERKAAIGKLPPATPYAVTARGAHHRVWQKTTYEIDFNGQAVPRLHQYTELATGLHFKNEQNQWAESKEEILPSMAGGAAAVKGQHQLYFPYDIYQGVIETVTPDGKHLKSRPVGISYFDGTNSVMIAILTNSVGQILPSGNQIIYQNAFSDFAADMVVTYHKNGMECDLVFREQPPIPEDFGLSPQTSRLELWTEFFDTPEPVKTIRAANPKDHLADTTLQFGKMKMVRGKAFVIGQSDPLTPSRREPNIPVYKAWTHIDGRVFLVEEVPVARVATQLQALPVAADRSGSSVPKHSMLRRASPTRLLPPARLAQSSTNAIRVAELNPNRKPGFVLDYVAIDSDRTDYTFQGDTTYYLSGEYNLQGTTVFEAGTVVKTDYDGRIDIDEDGTVVCNTGSYRPAVFTSLNDNSVGEPIGSGSPVVGDVTVFLYINAGEVTLHDLRFSYCWYAAYQDPQPSTIDVWNCQFMNGDVAIWGYDIGLHNVLIGRSIQSSAAVCLEGPSLIGENVTADYGFAFIQVDYYGATVALTNCLVTGQVLVTNYSGLVTTHTNSTASILSPAGLIYQTAGAGSFYLADGSPYRNAGTVNIDSTLLAALKTKTTYPPIVYSNTTISVETTFNPQAQRDTDTPDLGYHYDPIDYFFGGVESSANITLTPGTAVGWFELPGIGGPSYGIALGDDGVASFNGTVKSPCVFARYETVQEGGNGNWLDRGWLAGISGQGNFYTVHPSHVLATFTRFAETTGDGGFYRDYYGILEVNATHCEFYSGTLGGYVTKSYYTNCLMDRMYLWQGAADESPRMVLRNCTYRGGSLGFSHWEGGSPYWYSSIRDCVFEGTVIGMDYADPAYTDYDYNAYLTGADQTSPSGAHDVVTNSFHWQSSSLRNYYLPGYSSLIDAGSRTADVAGLYHFTTQIDQTKETNSVVDIGYHYVAVDSNGHPLDTDGDGVPDYLEDANGNGAVNSGETDWQSATDLGLKVLITRPKNNSAIP